MTFATSILLLILALVIATEFWWMLFLLLPILALLRQELRYNKHGMIMKQEDWRDSGPVGY